MMGVFRGLVSDLGYLIWGGVYFFSINFITVFYCFEEKVDFFIVFDFFLFFSFILY